MQGGALGKSDRTQSFLAASHSNPRILIDSQNKATKGVCVLEADTSFRKKTREALAMPESLEASK